MNKFSAIHFGLAALNIGCMIWSICIGNAAWFLNLAAAGFCLCNGILSLD